MRLIAANLDLIDDDMRDDPEAMRIFLDLMLKHGNPERALRRMNELGVLSAFIPEFETIVAMMQFNVYHHYTVDEHIIQMHLGPGADRTRRTGRGTAAVIGDPEGGREPQGDLCRAVAARHRQGPPRGSFDHRRADRPPHRARGLGLTPRNAETVEWLVRYHLLMSDMAQKRDIGDPRTVRDFAKAVKTRKRLDLLTVLTVCDIRGVGPGTWNNWKAMLLRQLVQRDRRGAGRRAGNASTAKTARTRPRRRCANG